MGDEWRVEITRLEGRMNTMQAEYKTDIALLAEQLAEREARLAEQRAERDARLEKELAAVRTEAAQRETNLVLRIAALLAGAVAILGVLIRVL